MAEPLSDILPLLLHSAAADWLTTLAFIFGGCCSNAWALELITSRNPRAGSLITFAQFLLVSAYGLRKHITMAPAPVLREDVLHLVVGNLVRMRRGEIHVAVEGHGVAARAFADELARAIEWAAPTLPLRRMTFAGDVKDVYAQLGSLGSAEAPEDAVVLVDGEHLDAGGNRIRWDYSVVLVSKGDFPPASRESAWPDALLTVDMTVPTHPVILFPVPRRTLLDRFTRIRLKKRSIPISRWAVQVALFLLTSLLNNAAFGYNVPMSVHIIFRSGGLVVNMIMGWLIDKRRYNTVQVISVLLVTLGVVSTTLSASQSRPSGGASASALSSPGSYSVGILILTLALVMSGFMGLAQDRTYAQYGRGHWEEAMFYLHFLALPGFTFVWGDLVDQVRAANSSARVAVNMEPLAALVTSIGVPGVPVRVLVPSFYFPLLLNVVTQVVCVSGVHRLTSRVSSLTVTLVLAVRKATSLWISVTLSQRGGGGLLWTGAGLVLAGTIGYSIGSRPTTDRNEDTKKER